jgi:hypothetical protein
LRDWRWWRGAADVQVVRDFAAVGVALGQVLRDVERDGFAEVDYEIGDALGEGGVDGGNDH